VVFSGVCKLPAFIAALGTFFASGVGQYMLASAVIGVVTYAAKRLTDSAVKRS